MACFHRRHVPVELTLTSEEVARLCLNCWAQLPAHWSGETEAVFAWGNPEPVRVIAVG